MPEVWRKVIQEGRQETIIEFVKKNLITKEQAIEQLDITEEQLHKLLKKYKA